MEYSITMAELISRPVIRDDKYPKFLNKMTDEEIAQYYKEADKVLEEEGILKEYPEWSSAQLKQIIDRDILYNLFQLSLTGEDDRKNVYIGLTRLDLQRHKEDLPLDEVSLYDFKASSISMSDLNKADTIVFTDNGQTKYLKDRYSAVE